MKTRLLALLVLALPLSTLSTDKPAPSPTVITVKRSAIQVGNSSFALVKGTKLEVIGREGKMLLVKYRTSQGKIPYADTDYVLTEEEQAEEEAAPEPPAPVAPAKPPATPAPKSTTVPPTTPAVPAPAAKALPPALSTNPSDKQPTSTYGKMVQKAKQAEQAHNDKLVKPADEILDEKPKK